MKKYLVPILLGALCLPASLCVAESGAELDKLYGRPNRPSFIKHYEADKDHHVLLNPYLQVGSKKHKAMLDPKRPVYNYVVTQEGNVAFIEEAPHPYGRTYPKGFYRPKDKSQRKPGTTENYGHVSGTAGGPGRMSGEIINDSKNKCWKVNNKSGRYSKRNPDRTPEQFLNTFELFKETADPNGMPWCKSAIYLLAYAPGYISKELRESPDMRYEDEKTKKNAHILVAPGAKIPKYEIPPYQHLNLDDAQANQPNQAVAAPAAPGAPAPEIGGGKAPYNDDPS